MIDWRPRLAVDERGQGELNQRDPELTRSSLTEVISPSPLPRGTLSAMRPVVRWNCRRPSTTSNAPLAGAPWFLARDRDVEERKHGPLINQSARSGPLMEKKKLGR